MFPAETKTESVIIAALIRITQHRRELSVELRTECGKVCRDGNVIATGGRKLRSVL